MVPPTRRQISQRPPSPFEASARQAPGVVSDEAKFLAALPVIDDVTGQVCRRHRLGRDRIRRIPIGRPPAFHRAQLRSAAQVRRTLRAVDIRQRRRAARVPRLAQSHVGALAAVDRRAAARSDGDPDRAARDARRLVARPGARDDQASIISSSSTRRCTAFCNTFVGARTGRRMVSEDDAAEVASPGPTADDNLVMAERDFLAKRVQTALDRARQALPPMDRLILKMRFEDRAAVSDIARALHIEQRPLYRTLERLLKIDRRDHAGRRHFARRHRRAISMRRRSSGRRARTPPLCRRQTQQAVRNERGPRGDGPDDQQWNVPVSRDDRRVRRRPIQGPRARGDRGSSRVVRDVLLRLLGGGAHARRRAAPGRGRAVHAAPDDVAESRPVLPRRRRSCSPSTCSGRSARMVMNAR